VMGAQEAGKTSGHDHQPSRQTSKMGASTLQTPEGMHAGPGQLPCLSPVMEVLTPGKGGLSSVSAMLRPSPSTIQTPRRPITIPLYLRTVCRDLSQLSVAAWCTVARQIHSETSQEEGGAGASGGGEALVECRGREDEI
jgi:hypothetical protein